MRQLIGRPEVMHGKCAVDTQSGVLMETGYTSVFRPGIAH